MTSLFLQTVCLGVNESDSSLGTFLVAMVRALIILETCPRRWRASHLDPILEAAGSDTSVMALVASTASVCLGRWLILMQTIPSGPTTSTICGMLHLALTAVMLRMDVARSV